MLFYVYEVWAFGKRYQIWVSRDFEHQLIKWNDGDHRDDISSSSAMIGLTVCTIEHFCLFYAVVMIKSWVVSNMICLSVPPNDRILILRFDFGMTNGTGMIEGKSTSA